MAANPPVIFVTVTDYTTVPNTRPTILTKDHPVVHVTLTSYTTVPAIKNTNLRASLGILSHTSIDGISATSVLDTTAFSSTSSTGQPTSPPAPISADRSHPNNTVPALLLLWLVLIVLFFLCTLIFFAWRFARGHCTHCAEKDKRIQRLEQGLPVDPITKDMVRDRENTGPTPDRTSVTNSSIPAISAGSLMANREKTRSENHANTLLRLEGRSTPPDADALNKEFDTVKPSLWRRTVNIYGKKNYGRPPDEKRGADGKDWKGQDKKTTHAGPSAAVPAPVAQYNPYIYNVAAPSRGYHDFYDSGTCQAYNAYSEDTQRLTSGTIPCNYPAVRYEPDARKMEDVSLDEPMRKHQYKTRTANYGRLTPLNPQQYSYPETGHNERFF